MTFKRDLNIELCDLVNKNDFTEEAINKTEELYEKGVDVSYQDQNRDGNTPLHLAIEHENKSWVEFLLQFKPKFGICNNKGETPLDVAKRKDKPEILQVLLPQPETNANEDDLDTVQQKFVQEFHYDELWMQLSRLNSQQNLKILKVFGCPSISQFVCEMQLNAKLLHDASHLLIFIIHVLESCDGLVKEHLNSLRLVFPETRPSIIQIMQPDKSPIIYCMEENEHFIRVLPSINQVSPEETIKTMLNSENCCTFGSLLEALRLKVFGCFENDIMGTMLDSNKFIELLNNCSKLSTLSIRFLKLFCDLMTDVSWTTMLGYCIKRASYSNLLALFDFPFFLLDSEPVLHYDQQELLDVREYGHNLLMLAVLENNPEAVTLCIKLEFDLNEVGEDKQTFFDIAWKLCHYKCLAEIINEDAKFPCPFSISEIDTTKISHVEVTSLVVEREKFHNDIKTGLLEEVKDYIEKRIRLKYAYNTNNHSAITTALIAKQFEIYSFLRSTGFISQNDDEFKKLTNEERVLITTENKKFFSFDENYHLSFFLSRSRLGYNNKKRVESFESIRKMYEKLNTIDYIVPVLKTVASSEQLDIVFDFNNDSVADMDITKSTQMGTSYNKIGYIYIAAKDFEEKEKGKEIIGVLAHELTHYAMALIYDNGCKPFDEKDNDNRKYFLEIMENVQKFCKNSSHIAEEIVGGVFSYAKEFQIAELIVRVPHLLAKYSEEPKKLADVKIQFDALFTFYSEKTIKDMSDTSRDIKLKRKIKEFNSLIGLLKEIDNYNLSFTTTDLSQIKDEKISILSSNVPIMTLAMIVQYLRHISGSKFEKVNVFGRVETIQNEISQIKLLLESPLKPHLVIDFTNKFNRNKNLISDLSKTIGNCRNVLLVMTREEAALSMREFFGYNHKFLDFNHKWDDLAENAKNKYLQREISFQGSIFKLDELISAASKVAQELPLYSLTMGETIEIGSDLNNNLPKFYIPRSFIKQVKIEDDNMEIDVDSIERPNILFKKNDNFKYMKYDVFELLKEAEESKIIIISDIAGTGKSTCLYEIAKVLKIRNRDHFVFFVKLQHCIEGFENVKTLKDAENFPEFMANVVMKSRDPLEIELFLELFEKGKVFVLLDGFDEICPVFKDLTLTLVKSFSSTSGNQLWITTRSHLESDLEKNLNQKSHSLSSLTKEDQIGFLIKSWQSKKNETKSLPTFLIEQVASSLISKLSVIMKSYNFIGLPLLVNMIANIYENDILSPDFYVEQLENLDLYSLYDKFVSNMIKIWMEEKGMISLKEQEEIHKKQNTLLNVHQHLALTHIFGGNLIPIKNFIKYWGFERILRIGILTKIDDSAINFVHKTIAEFLVASFLIDCINFEQFEYPKLAELLMKVMIDYDHHVIRKFLDNAMNICFLSESANKTNGNQLEHKMKQMERYDILHHTLGEGNNNLAKFILDSLTKISSEVLEKVLRYAEKDKNNALHKACQRNNSIVVESICQLIRKKFNRKVQKELFQLREHEDENIFLLSAYNIQNEKIFFTLVENLKKVLSSDEIKMLLQDENYRGNNILNIIAENNNEKQLPDTISTLQEFMCDFKEILFRKNKDGDSCVYQAARFGSKNLIEILFDFMESHLSTEEQRELIKSTGQEDVNIFFFAVVNTNDDIFVTVRERLQKFFQREEIKTFLQQKDREGNNLLLWIACLNRTKQLPDVISTLQKLLTNDELKQILVYKNKNDANCIQQAATSGSESSVEIFLNFMRSCMSIEEQIELLRTRSKDNYNLFLRIAFNEKNDKIFSTLQKHLEKSLSREEIKSLLLEKNIQNLNVLSLFAFQNNEKHFLDAVSVLEKNFTIDELKTLLWNKDENGNNCVHHAVERGNKNIIDSAFDLMKRLLSVEEQKNLLESRGINNQNILSFATCNINEGTFLTLQEHLEKYFDRETMKSFLNERNFGGANMLSLVLHFNNERNLPDVMSMIKEYLNADELKNFLWGKNNFGSNFLHSAIKNGSKYLLEILFNFLHSNLSNEEQKELLQSKAQHNKTVFLLAASNLKHKIFFMLLERLQIYFNRGEIKSFLQHTDDSGDNILSLLAYHNNEENLSHAILILQDFLTADELKTILHSENQLKNNCLHFAVRFGNKNVIELMFNFLDCNVSIKERQNLLEMRGPYGLILFRLAALNSENEEVFPMLMKCLQNSFDIKQIKYFIQEENHHKANVLSVLVDLNNKNQLFDAISLLQTFLSADELKNLLLAKNKHGDSCVHQAIKSGNKILLEFLLNFFEENLSIHEQKELFESKGHNNKNILLSAALNTEHEGIFSTLLKYLETHFNREEIKSLLLEKDVDGENILTLIFKQNNEKQLLAAFPILREFLTDAELKIFVQEKNKFGYNCVSIAIIFGNKSLIVFLFSLLETFLTLEEQQDLFKLRDPHNRTIVLQATCNIKFEDTFSTLWGCLMEVFSCEDITSFLQEKENEGSNILSLITIRGNDKLFPDAISILQNFLSDEELKNLVKDEDIYGNNCIHTAFRCANKATIELLCKFIEGLFTIEEQQHLFRKTGFRGRNILLQASFNTENTQIFLILRECLEKNLSFDDIKSFLLEKDIDGCSIFDLTDSQNNEQLSDLFLMIQKFLTADELKSIIQNRNTLGGNCLHQAAAFGDKHFITSLFSFLEKILSKGDRKDLFKLLGSENKNIFHFAASNSYHKEIFSLLLKFLNVLEKSEMKLFLQGEDVDGLNVFSLIANKNNKIILPDVLSVLQTILSADEIKDLLWAKDKLGNGCVRKISKLGGKDFVAMLLNYLGNLLSIEEQNELFQD